jgi:hypothetical protein
LYLFFLLQFSFFYVLSFILIIIGVFIYNLRQPSTAKPKKSKNNDENREGEGGRGTKVLSGLRRALFESQTYEMSAKSSRASTASPPPTTASERKGVISKLISKLARKLPSPPTPADHSALQSSSRQRMRTFENLAENDITGGGGGFFDAPSKEGLIHDRRSSSGSEGVYGSVERTTQLVERAKRRTASPRTSSSASPPPSAPHQ